MSAKENKGVKRERDEEITLSEEERGKMRRTLYQLAAEQPEEFRKVMDFSNKIDCTMARIEHGESQICKDGNFFEFLDHQRIRNILTRLYVKRADANENNTEPIIANFIEDSVRKVIAKLCNSDEFYELLEEKLNNM